VASKRTEQTILVTHELTSKSQRSNRPSKFLSHLGEFPHFLDLGLRLRAIESRRLTLRDGSKSRISRDPIIILPSQESLVQRRPDCSAIVVELIERCVFSFDPLTNEHVVLRLLDNWSLETKTSRDMLSMFDFEGGPFARSPVMGMAVLDQGVERSHGFLHGSTPEIGSMGIDYIDRI
jgi:hypothetical protein